MHVLGVARILHMFEDDAGRDVGSEAAASPIILASLHISGCNMLLTMPIMSPQCSLTRVMLYALTAFVKFQESENLRCGAVCHADASPCLRYSPCM